MLKMSANTQLLLLSNSRGADGAFLTWPRQEIRAFLETQVAPVLFIPFAAVPGTGVAYDAYA
jgi:hypothetical protein